MQDDVATKSDLNELEFRMEKGFDDLKSYLDRLVVTFEARFQRIEEKLDTKADKTDVDKILNTLDGHTKTLDDHTVELAAISSQLTRHDRWHREVANNIGFTLTP